MLPNECVMNYGVLLLMILITLLIRHLEGAWSAPGTAMASVWTIISALPVLIRPEITISSDALMLVTAFLFLYGMGTFCGKQLFHGNSCYSSIPRRFYCKREVPILLLMICAGSFVPYDVISQYDDVITGSSVQDALSLVAREESVRRYSGEMSNVLNRIFTVFVYTAPLLGGLIYHQGARVTTKMLTVFSPLVALAVTVVSTAKMPALIGIICFLSSMIVGSLFRNGPTFRSWNWKKVSGTLVLAAGLFMIFSFTQALRAGVGLFDRLDLISRKMESYLYVALPQMTDWIDRTDLFSIEPSYGTHVFAGVAEWFGISDRKPGIYQDLVIVGWYSSNVQGFIRYLVDDFTLPIGFLMVFLIGVIAGRAYSAVAAGRFGAITPLILIYVWTVWSPITSIFAYNTIIGSFLCLYICLHFFCRRGRDPASRHEKGQRVARGTPAWNTLLRSN